MSKQGCGNCRDKDQITPLIRTMTWTVNQASKNMMWIGFPTKWIQVSYRLTEFNR